MLHSVKLSKHYKRRIGISMKKFMSVFLASVLCLVLASGLVLPGPATVQAEEKVSIRQAIWDVNQEPFYDEAIALFNEENPNIEIVVEITPWAQYWTSSKLLQQVAVSLTPSGSMVRISLSMQRVVLLNHSMHVLRKLGLISLSIQRPWSSSTTSKAINMQFLRTSIHCCLL